MLLFAEQFAESYLIGRGDSETVGCFTTQRKDEKQLEK